MGEEVEPSAKVARRRGHAAEVSRANQAGQDPGDEVEAWEGSD